MDGWKDGRMDGWMDQWMEEWMDVTMYASTDLSLRDRPGSCHNPAKGECEFGNKMVRLKSSSREPQELSITL